MTLTRKQAERCWKGIYGGQERVFLSEADLRFAGESLVLSAEEGVDFDFSVFPKPEHPCTVVSGNYSCSVENGQDGIFARFRISDGDGFGTDRTERTAGTSIDGNALRRSEISGNSCEWEIPVPLNALADSEDLFLSIEYSGNTAELYLDDCLVADNFYTGLPWVLGLKRFRPLPGSGSFTLKITGLFETSPVVTDIPPVFKDGRALELHRVSFVRQRTIEIGCS